LLVVVAVRPPEVAPLRDAHQLLGRQLGALLGGEALRPVLEELVAPVLRGVHRAVARVEGEAHRVADARRVPPRRPELLPRPVGGEAPDAGARRELGARVGAGRPGLPVGLLARVGLGADVHEQGAASVEQDVVGRVAAHRQPGDHRLRLARGR
jgi:hypothetical protein